MCGPVQNCNLLYVWRAELKEIQEEQRRERIFKIITGVFNLVVSVGTLCMGIPDVKGLTGFAEVLKAATDNFDSIKDVFDTSLELGESILDSSTVQQLDNVDMPSDEDWDEYINHVEGQCDSLNVEDARQEIVAYKVAARVSFYGRSA